MINEEKWINSISKDNTKFKEEINQLDYNIWVNTISKKNTYNSFKKYSLLSVFFIFGLLFVSAVKNETRNLQKEINNLQTSINLIQFNLDQAILDNEVITSPENISQLAKEHLNTDLEPYKISQIKKLDQDSEIFAATIINKKTKKLSKKNKNLSLSVKSEVAKRIKQKKAEISKLKKLYSNPESIPEEIKTKVAKQIKEKQTELKNIYHSPKDTLTIQRAQRWAVVQVVKAFLGMPIVPGR